MTSLPQRLTGCAVLPPLVREDLQSSHVERHNGQSSAGHRSKAKEPNDKRKAAADRFAVLNNFIDFTMAVLTRNELAVWLVLYRDSRDGIARTAQSDIARRAGVTRRTVVRVLQRLEGLKLLKTVHQGGMRRGVSIYRVIPLKPPTDV